MFVSRSFDVVESACTGGEDRPGLNLVLPHASYSISENGSTPLSLSFLIFKTRIITFASLKCEDEMN